MRHRPGTSRKVKVMHPSPSIRLRATVAATGLAGLTALVALGAGLTAAPPAAAAAAAPSAQAEYQAAIKTAGHDGVHFVSTATQGTTSIRVTGDTGATTGSQNLTVKNGKLTEHVTAMIAGSNGYVKANATALHNVLGLTNAQSSKYANAWLSFPISNTGLDQLVGGLLNAEVPTELKMNAPYTFGKTATVSGQRALAIRGTVSTSNGGTLPVVMYVPAVGSPRPIQEVTNPGSTGATDIRGTVTFSNWGEKTTETAPAHSVSLLKLVPASSSSSSG
jgi:hypothetical protein